MNDKLIDITVKPISELLPLLLQDKTTGENIIWATDKYGDQGDGYQGTQQILLESLKAHPDLIMPRICKSQEEQKQRTKKKAEVFTPSWLCNEMANYLMNDWFGKKGVFNTEVTNPDGTHDWIVNEDIIEHPADKPWTKFADCRCLEITCGEAPFLISRYDAATGVRIEPVKKRVGLLDRKMRVVGEQCNNYDTWMKWAFRVYESIYGYEFQGDSLLIARINMVLTFCDYHRDKWGTEPDIKTLKKLCNIIAWNVWQMDGLKDTIPYGRPAEVYHQVTLGEAFGAATDEVADPIYCKIKNWRSREVIVFNDLKPKKEEKKKGKGRKKTA